MIKKHTNADCPVLRYFKYMISKGGGTRFIHTSKQNVHLKFYVFSVHITG